MTPKELRASILQQAIQGKLTTQLPADGNADDMLQNISLANDVDGQRVKQKVITNITEDDMTFEIPANWAWIKLGSVCVIARGGSPRPIKEYLTDSEDGINWIKIGDTEKNGKYISSTAERIKPSGVSKSRMVHAGDFLLTNSMSFGRPYILKIDGCIHDGWLVISQKSEVFIPDYLYWLLSSQYAYMQFCDKVSGAVVKNLNSDKVANSVFPLPPIEEQKRIVAKLEEILPLIDRYEAAWNKLEEFNKRFPGDMQKSILQLAIQGKLVEQRPEEGTGEDLFQQIQAEKQALIKAGKIKKEKPLPEISDDEIPFDIPDTWKWVQFGTLYSLSNGTASRGSKDGSDHPVLRLADLSNNIIDTSNIRKIKLTDKEFASHMVQKDDLIFIRVNGSKDRVATAFRYTAKDIISYCDHLFCGHKCSSLVDADYIMFIFNCPSTRKQLLPEIKTTAGQNTISQGSMAKILLPLPPLAEQKRIVAKLEEVLPLCDRLK